MRAACQAEGHAIAALLRCLVLEAVLVAALMMLALAGSRGVVVTSPHLSEVAPPLQVVEVAPSILRGAA